MKEIVCDSGGAAKNIKGLSSDAVPFFIISVVNLGSVCPKLAEFTSFWILPTQAY
jgi:hypothetical protein